MLGQPFIESYENASVVYNELLVSAYLYTLLGLSANTVCDQDLRINMGYTLLAIIFVSTACNLLKTIVLISIEAVHLKRVRDARLRYEASLEQVPESPDKEPKKIEDAYPTDEEVVAAGQEEVKSKKKRRMKRKCSPPFDAALAMMATQEPLTEQRREEFQRGPLREFRPSILRAEGRRILRMEIERRA